MCTISCWVPPMLADTRNLQACEEAAGKPVSEKVQRSMGVDSPLLPVSPAGFVEGTEVGLSEGLACLT